MYRMTLLLALAACSAPLAPKTGFRPAGGPIYSNAVLDDNRLSGTWTQVAGMATKDAAPCSGGALKITPQAAKTSRIDGQLCLSGQLVRVAGQLSPIGPGRFSLQGADPAMLGQPWWVLWADVGYRTLVIGTPSGDFGFILNNDGPLPQDRRNAAREILDWNGYDLSRLINYGPAK